MSIQVGSGYLAIYQTLGLVNMIKSFIIGLIFYTIMLYGIYRIDLKVRNKINGNDIKY